MRTLWIYLGLLAAFVAVVIGGLSFGDRLPPAAGEAMASATAAVAPGAAPTSASWLKPLLDNFKDPLSRLLLQLVVVLLATRLLGGLFRKLKQPPVVGEVIAGIMLGPSLLGWVWPSAQQLVFAPESLGVLRLLSQIGVCLFMFVIGLELDVEQLRKQARQAVIVSHVGILFPFSLGVFLALFLFHQYAPANTRFIAFGLFMGIALSITAFPVLARILKERRMDKTQLGATAITCAAIDDATAWIILAFVVAIARATDLISTAAGLGLLAVFVVVMMLGLRPRLPRWLGVADSNHPEPSSSILVVVLLVILVSSFASEVIGVHAMFGAFMAGVVMPQSKRFRDYLVVRLESFSSLFLLPLFFAFSGLRTRIGLLDDSTTWLVCGLVIAVATAGKLGGCMLTARCMGMNWNESFKLGALMNTRGLVELVALNVGYDLGILTPRIFAVMVLMAVTTTVMTGPLLNLAERWQRRRASDLVSARA